jgi:hypothetical protein
MKSIKVNLIILSFLLTAGFLSGQDREEVRSFLLSTDKQSMWYDEELSVLEKVNMGIPGGDNWLVVWSDGNSKFAKIYVIYGTEVKREMEVVIISGDPRDFSFFDVYQSLPGMTIENGMCQIGDFNGDGLDESLTFVPGSPNPRIEIFGYDQEIDDKKYYCAIPYGIIDPENGPSPVEFVTYKGMRGFRVYYDLYYRPKGGDQPKNIIKNNLNEEYAWYFYTWDEEAREYVEVEEYIEDAGAAERAGESAGVQPEQEQSPPVLVPADPMAPIQAPAAPSETIPGSRRSILFVTLAVGLFVFSLVIGIVLLKKKSDRMSGRKVKN